MKNYFIINPLAGNGEKIKELEAGVSKIPAEKNCFIYPTKAPKDATEFVKKTCSENPDEKFRFIACGGDGTINEVFNGAMGFENAEVTVFPCGSGNDFVKTFGGAEKFTDLEKLVDAPVRKLDAMKVGDLYSFNVTNFGFDTTVAITVNEDRAKNGHGSKSSYTKGIVKALIKSMNNRFQVIADGEVMNPSGRALLCTVGNGQYVGGSFKCAPRAETDDGLLEVCLVDPISRLKFVKLLPVYTAGDHIDNKDFSDVIHYKRAKVIEVYAEDGFAYSLDGEIIYAKKFVIEAVPGALNFACPE